MTSLKVRLFGTFEVRDSADRPIAVSAKKNRGLLAILAFSPTASRERLANLLWGDREDAQARSSLRQALASLRKDLGEINSAHVTADDETIALDHSQVEIDAVSFQRLAGSDDYEQLHQALLLYRGELLADTTISDPAFTDWIAMERARLHDLAVTALEKLWTMEEGRARINLAKRLAALEPLKESAHQALMQSYAEAGEDGLALQHYAACRNLLKAELGITPGREIEALRLQLLGRGSTETIPAKIQHRPGIRSEPASPGLPKEAPAMSNSDPGLPDRPSIAVLPFQNMSGDPEQEYFADGIVEEIIIALSRLHWLFVIARNSSFAYKGHAVDVKQIGRELGVRYVLEGSVRKAADKIRITGQLIDASTGVHLWADRFDGGLEDIFDLQDQVTARVVGEIAPRLE